MTFYDFLIAVLYLAGIVMLFVFAAAFAVVASAEISRIGTVELPYTFFRNVEFGADGAEKEIFQKCHDPKELARKIYEKLGIKIVNDDVEKKVFEAKLPRGVYYTTDKFTYLHKINDEVFLVFYCDKILAIRDLNVIPKECLCGT